MRLFVTRLLLAYGLTVGLAFAGPLLQIQGGFTTIYLSDDMLTALTDCRLERVMPSVVMPDQRRVKMRVVGGALDSDSLGGEAAHNGGITIVCWGMGTESVVTMQNFLLDSLQETPEITALVQPNGILAGEDYKGSIHQTTKYLLGGKPANGWLYWYIKNGADDFQSIDDIREKYREDQKENS